MSISLRILLILLALAAVGQAVAESQAPTSPGPGHCESGAAVAQCPALPASNARLRQLRLQDAVEDGDLSAQDAAQFLATHPSSAHKTVAAPHHDSSQPGHQLHDGKPRHRFWREERRRLSSEQHNNQQ